MHSHPLQPYWTEKAKAVMRQKRESGRHLGKAPIGYKNVRIDGEPAIVIDPEKAEAVRALFEAVAAEISIRKAGRLAWQAGLKSRSGKQLGPSSLYAVLTNPFYIGMARWNGRLIGGGQQALLEECLFEKVQKNLRE